MSYEDEVLADSPIGAWMLQGNANALEGSNGTPSDVTFGSGNGPAPELPGAAVFNGTTSGINFGNQSPNTGPGEPWTYEAWVRLDAVGSTRYRFFAQSVSGNSQAPRLTHADFSMAPGDLGCEYRRSSGSDRVFVAFPASAETWYHLVAVHTGTQLRLYVNGELADTANDDSCHQQTNNLQLGTDGTDFLPGRAAGIAVYGSALSAERVEAHFDAAFEDDGDVNGSAAGAYDYSGLAAGDGDPPPIEVPGSDTSALTNLTNRAGKGQRWHWWTGTRWDGVIPTSSGWRLYTDLTGSMTQGAVVDERQDARVDVVFHDGTLWVARGHATAPRISRYLLDGGGYTADEVDVALPAGLAVSDNDSHPLIMLRSTSGRLWVARNNGSDVVIAVSDNDGDTWSSADVIEVTASGVVMLAQSSDTIVLISVQDDGDGRDARTIAQDAGDISAGEWGTESLPALPDEGLSSDDHGAAISVDGHIYAVSKTTGSTSSATPLLYMMHRTPAGAWTHIDLVNASDNTANGTRPQIVGTDSTLFVSYGTSGSGARLLTIPRDTLVVPSFTTLLFEGNHADGGFPPRVVSSQSGLLWLVHNRTAETIWRVWQALPPSVIWSEPVFASTLSDADEGTAAGEYDYAGSASGQVTLTGSASGAYDYSGTAAGTASAAEIQGSADGDYTYSGTADGAATPSTAEGTAAGEYTYAGTAAGSGEAGAVDGAASATYDYAGTADGSVTVTGSAAGSYTYTGTADGQAEASTAEGTAAGSYAYQGAAEGTGEAGPVFGTADGTYAYSGAAQGSVTVLGGAAGTYGYAGTADGTATLFGTAAGSYVYAGSALGSGFIPPLVDLHFIPLAPELGHGPAIGPEMTLRIALAPELGHGAAGEPEMAVRVAGEPEPGGGAIGSPETTHGQPDHDLVHGAAGAPTV